MIYILLIVAVAVGVFIFVKNNPKKVATIDNAAKDAADKVKNVIK